ncbi:MAG TPA: Ig-like domain-containing protein [Pirellulales bacterium]|nr:Ig-like domain-containing protein [Pirellulales bacterium]
MHCSLTAFLRTCVGLVAIGLLTGGGMAGAGAASPAAGARPPAKTEVVADPLARLKPGEWYEVPNSQLKEVAAPVAQFPWLSGGIGGIVNCWAGGAFDTQRDRLYLGPGGGHAGYNGNEIYAFDLNDLKWHRLNDPNPVIPGTEYTDLNVAPFAMHTYDGVQYIPPPADRYVVVGGWGTPRTYALNPARPDRWEVYPDHGTGRTGDLSAVDPNTGLLWLSTPISAGKLSQWDPIAHRWTLRRNDSPNPSYYETADIDSKRSRLVSCGRGKVKCWTLRPIPEPVDFAEWKTTGDTAVIDAPSPGFCYVAALDRFVAWANGADVYLLDPETKVWTKQPAAATNRVVPGPADQWGTFGRFRYSPAKNVFVLYNAVTQNVYLYRLSDQHPNPITGVTAKRVATHAETGIARAALQATAHYADGTEKKVTAAADYFSLDPAVATVERKGGGVVRGVKAGEARIRVVYTDPRFQRGFEDEVRIAVQDITAAATLQALHVAHPRLTLPRGDSFALEATGDYTRGAERFTLACTNSAQWTSDQPQIATVAGGVIQAVQVGGPILVRAVEHGRIAQIEVTVVEQPSVQRISFRVHDTPPRAGWLADNGAAWSASRRFGWLKPAGLITRDDRGGGKHPLLKSFVAADHQQFRVQVAPGEYTVRISMGDADYGAIPFDKWVAYGDEKLLYYEGHANQQATKIVTATDDGLTFTVNGPINYLIIAPLGVNLDKYADDGLDVASPAKKDGR